MNEAIGFKSGPIAFADDSLFDAFHFKQRVLTFPLRLLNLSNILHGFPETDEATLRKKLPFRGPKY